MIIDITMRRENDRKIFIERIVDFSKLWMIQYVPNKASSHSKTTHDPYSGYYYELRLMDVGEFVR